MCQKNGFTTLGILFIENRRLIGFLHPNRKGGFVMKIVLVRSPAFLAPILRKFFGIGKKKR